ncbi:MAG: hypothetical protein K0R47_4048 [Brevibacillus sp.]|nr:hypothetical protein [Brevibacillus sp.]
MKKPPGGWVSGGSLVLYYITHDADGTNECEGEIHKRLLFAMGRDSVFPRKQRYISISERSHSFKFRRRIRGVTRLRVT